MSEQSDLAKVLKKAHKGMTNDDASKSAKMILDELAEARRRRWPLVPVADTKGEQHVSPLKKTDFKSLLAVFAEGKWVGYVKPGTSEVVVYSVVPLKK